MNHNFVAKAEVLEKLAVPFRDFAGELSGKAIALEGIARKFDELSGDLSHYLDKGCGLGSEEGYIDYFLDELQELRKDLHYISGCRDTMNYV